MNLSLQVVRQDRDLDKNVQLRSFGWLELEENGSVVLDKPTHLHAQGYNYEIRPYDLWLIDGITYWLETTLQRWAISLLTILK